MIDDELVWLATGRRLFYSMCAAHATGLSHSFSFVDQVRLTKCPHALTRRHMHDGTVRCAFPRVRHDGGRAGPSGHFYLLLMQTPVCWVYCMHTATCNVLQRASVGPQGVVLEWRAACFLSVMLPIISHFYAHVKLIPCSREYAYDCWIIASRGEAQAA